MCSGVDEPITKKEPMDTDGGVVRAWGERGWEEGSKRGGGVRGHCNIVNNNKTRESQVVLFLWW